MNYKIDWEQYVVGFKKRKGNVLIEKLILWLFEKYNIPDDKKEKLNELIHEAVVKFDNEEVKNAIIESFIKLIGEEISKDFDNKMLEMKNTAKNQVKLCSFSKSYSKNNSRIMWSHYGENHTGACLEFNIGNLWLNSFRNNNPDRVNESIVPHIVEYQNELQDLSLETEREFYKAIKCKQEEWKYEEEVRLIHLSDNNNEYEDIDFPFSHMTKVIFGLRMDQERINMVIEAINRNEKIGDIKFEKMTLDEQTGVLFPLEYVV